MRAIPATHMPLRSHVSLPLQTLPSEHEVPTAAGACLMPVVGSQLSIVHGLSSFTTTAVPRQLPPAQLSPLVQTFPSLQAVPSALAGFEHTPVAGSHAPTP